MTLEARAVRAAGAIRVQAARVDPGVSIGVLVRRRRRIQVAEFAGAAAVVAAAVVVGIMLTPRTAPEVADTPPPIPATTLVAVDPIDEVLPAEPVPEAPEAASEPPAQTEPNPAPAAPLAPVDPGTEADVTPPLLEVTSPAAGARVDTSAVRFGGLTEPGATVAAGKYAADVAADGSWSIVLVLNPGGNIARFSAFDAAGNEASASLQLFYDPPPETGGGEAPPSTTQPPPEEPAPTTTTTHPPEEEPPRDVEFSAHQTYGSCEETPPYDVFYGTAEPGATITITSAYGGGSTTANEDGAWEKHVTFPEAPYAVVFAVTVADTAGNSRVFEFVSYAGG